MKRYRWPLALAAVVVLAFALLFVARRPDPLPNPNGYDDFVAAGRMVVGKPTSVGTNDPAALAKFAAENAGVATRVRAGLAHESRVPVRMNPEWLGSHMRELLAVKQAGNALQVLARQSEAEGHLAEAVALQLDRLWLGLGGARGGVLIDYGVGTAVESGALQDLRKLTNRLDAVLCRNVVKALHETETIREPFATMLNRERRWTWLGSGWWRTWDGAKEMTKGVFTGNAETVASFALMSSRDNQILRDRRELSLAFARRAFTLEQGRPPASDTELVPAYLPALPPAALPIK
jgi:hypothetical protein